jgi:hypothetical protein
VENEHDTSQQKLKINTPTDAVWAVLARFMHIDDFAPFITSVDALTDIHEDIGAKRRCHFDNGAWIIMLNMARWDRCWDRQ